MRDISVTLNDLGTLLKLTASIVSGKVVAFDYEGRLRLVEVHALGATHAGSLVIRGWQTAGESKTDTSPGWRLFTISKIENFRQLGTRSDAPRPGFNPNGDSQIADVFVIAKEPD